MLRGQLLELSGLLKEEEYKTASWLSEKMNISEKTVRSRIKDLKAVLQKHGADISSKARYGYRLEVTEREWYEALLEESGKPKEQIPGTGQERNQYLMAYLLNQKSYVKMENLCDFLYVSKTTLAHSLKSIESILNRYQLRIHRRPNYGIRLEGREVDIRRLISEYYIKRNGLKEMDWEHNKQERISLAEDVKRLLGKYEIHLSEVAFENFLDYLYVAQKRVKRGNYIKMEKETYLQKGVKERAFVMELIQVLEAGGEAVYTKDEENYLLVYLAGKRIIGNEMENDSNFIIHEKTDRLALSMIEAVKTEYHMDFRANFDVRMALNQHLVPFHIRMRYDIPLKNPLLEEVKTKYSLAYEMSYHACRILKEYYQKEIPEDEIGYFAFIFALALEKDKEGEANRSDILIVCSAGKGSSRLLKYKYELEFSDYLSNIYVCDWVGMESFDFSKVDYVFTTIPITIEVPVPILEVGLFLGNDDIQNIKGLLRRGNQGYLSRYYRKTRFLTGITGYGKEEVLDKLCRVIQTQERVDPDFYGLVLEREAYTQMDYGNYIAIPHPNRIASEETFAYLAVLKKPVIWNRYPVQVVLLTSIGRKEDKLRQRFYEATARFALNKGAVMELIEKPDYENFMRLLQG